MFDFNLPLNKFFLFLNTFFFQKNSRLLPIISAIFFLFFILFQTPIFGQQTPTRAFATLDSTVVTIGDKVTLHIGVEYDVSARITNTLPNLPLDTAKFSAVDLGNWGQEKARRHTYGRTIVFQAFDTGLYQIPSVSFVLAAANGVTETAQSPTLLLTVVNPNGAESIVSPVDNKPIIATEWTFQEDLLPFLKEYLPYFILFLALGFLAWRYWQQRKNRQLKPIIQEISQPPHIVAERLLAELRAKQLWQNGKTKEFYSELSRILRGYLEDQFKMPALETTTDELMELLKKRHFSGDVLEKIQDLLQTADLVKFAKVEPPTTIHDDFLIHAEAVVEATKPKPIVVEETIKTDS